MNKDKTRGGGGEGGREEEEKAAGGDISSSFFVSIRSKNFLSLAQPHRN